MEMEVWLLEELNRHLFLGFGNILSDQYKQDVQKTLTQIVLHLVIHM